MRKAHRTAGTVVLRLRFDDYTRATRSRSFLHNTASGADIGAAAVALLDAAEPLIRERGITLVGVALTRLGSDAVVQPVLPLDGPDLGQLDVAVDAVSERFGKGALVRGSLLRAGEGFSVPQLPD
jgi:DNA polymerase-4